jgi:DivIVA domain-containing protein
MPLTPTDVHNVAFSKPPIGKRGYHEDEVDAFLDLVQAELTRLIQDNADLRNQVAQLDQQLRAALVDTAPVRRPLEPPRPVMAPVAPPMASEHTSPGGQPHVHAAKVLGLAQEIADRMTSDAKTEADTMLSQAHATSQQLLSEAKAKAENMVTQAKSRAETLLNDARSRAETRDRESREKAAALERDAARKHTEILGALSQEKNTLEKKIDELRTFERDYRTRLKTYLQSQLHELDGHGPTAPLNPTRTHQDPVTSGSGARAQAR